MPVLAKIFELLALIALRQDARRVDEAERLVGDRGHVLEPIRGVVGDDLRDLREVFINALPRRDGQVPIGSILACLLALFRLSPPSQTKGVFEP